MLKIKYDAIEPGDWVRQTIGGLTREGVVAFEAGDKWFTEGNQMVVSRDNGDIYLVHSTVESELLTLPRGIELREISYKYQDRTAPPGMDSYVYRTSPHGFIVGGDSVLVLLTNSDGAFPRYSKVSFEDILAYKVYDPTDESESSA